jgi:hypothetical protein
MRMARLLLRYVLELARELSDESAYQRHLTRVGRTHSAAEWKLFIDRRFRRKYQNAKCC